MAMKKIVIVLLMAFVMLNVFSSSSGSISFDVHWSTTNPANTIISILPYSGSGTLPQDNERNYLKSVSPSDNSSTYNICLIKYKTNEKGIHKLRFSATPMIDTSNSEVHPYVLYITYGNGFPTEIMVGQDDKPNYEEIVFSAIGSGETTADFYLKAAFTDFNNMEIGGYSSTVTIMRISE